MRRAATVSSVPNKPAGRVSPVDDMSYEQARDELVAVVARLEAGGETLEGSLALWERGEALAARCQQWLDGARARLEAVRSPDTAAAPDEAADEADAIDGTTDGTTDLLGHNLGTDGPDTE